MNTVKLKKSLRKTCSGVHESLDCGDDSPFSNNQMYTAKTNVVGRHKDLTPTGHLWKDLK